MKSRLIKITVLILLLTIINIPNTTYAMDDIISQGDSFLGTADSTLPINETALQSTSNDIYNILFTIAVVLAVAIGMIIGIQFMIGSAAEQAKVKETLVPYVIGVFVVFASFTIWKIAVSIGNDVAPTVQNQTSTTTRPSTIRECPYCGVTLLSGQVEDLERYGTTTCRKANCGKTITN